VLFGWLIVRVNVMAGTHTITPSASPLFVELLYSLVLSVYFFTHIEGY
jgi:hypothetical protein